MGTGFADLRQVRGPEDPLPFLSLLSGHHLNTFLPLNMQLARSGLLHIALAVSGAYWTLNSMSTNSAGLHLQSCML